MKNRITILLSIVILLLIVPNVSALEFDNIKSYDEEERKVTITDNFGLGGKLVEITMLSNTDFCLVSCESIWNVTIHDNEDKFLTELEFFKDNEEETEVQNTFEVYQRTEDVQIQTYRNDCTNLEDKGYCDQVKDKMETGKKEIWTSINTRRKLPVGNYVIKLKGKKGPRQRIDWIPTFYGKKIKEWAFWTPIDPVAVWEFNEGSGNAIDSTGIHNLTISGDGSYTSGGKLNNATVIGNNSNLVFNGTNSADWQFGTGNFTVAFWWQTNSSTDAQMINTSRTGCADNGFDVNNFLGVPIMCGANLLYGDDGDNIADGTWHRVVFVREGTGANAFKKYVDNINTFNDTMAMDVNDSLSPIIFKSTSSSDVWNFDSFQVFKGFAWTPADVDFDWNSGSGREQVGLGTIAVTLNTPSNGFSTASSELIFNATASPTLVNLTNATLLLYNSSTELFLESTSVMNITVNRTSFNVSTLITGDFIWNVQFCGSINNASGGTVCNVALSNFTFNVGIQQLNSSFNNQTIEGNLEDFLQNVTLVSGTSISKAELIYNGTANIGEIIQGSSSTILRKQKLLVPNINQISNFSFFWSLTLSDGAVFNLSQSNQTVLNISIDDCTLFTNEILNFTVVDEELQTFLPNATLETAINIFDIGRSNSILNLSGNFTNPTTICLDINLTASSQYSLDTVVRYEDSLHANEYYNIVNLSLTNNTPRQDVRLFDLNLSDSTPFRVTFTGDNFLPVPDALVFLDRQYISENLFKTVELPLTDPNGQTILHLVRNDVVYNIRFLDSGGNILGSFEEITAFCEDPLLQNCQISLSSTSNISSTFNYDELTGLVFSSNPIFNSTTSKVSFNFIVPGGISKTVVMNVTRNDVFGNRTVCENSLTSSSGTLSCSVDPAISDTTLSSVVTVNGEIILLSSINIDSTSLGSIGYVLWFVLTLLLIFGFGDSKNMVLVSLLIGYVGALLLGITKGTILGFGAAGTWIVIITLLGIWRLNRDKTQ